MQIIKQRYHTDCGIASVAMIANCSYEKALKAVFPHRKKYSSYATTIEDLTNGLKKLKLKSNWKLPIIDNKKVSLLKLRKNAILILSFGDGDYHAVAYSAKQKAIFDPLIDKPIFLGKTRISVSNRKYTVSAQTFYEKKVFAYCNIITSFL